MIRIAYVQLCSMLGAVPVRAYRE